MLRQLFIHYLKEQRRSPAFHKNLGANIVIGLVVGLFMLNVLGLGLFIDRILAETAPDKDPIALFNRFVLYYFGIELLMRLLFSRPKIQAIMPYLYLPVRRSALVHYIVSRSFLSLFNLFPLLIAVPFALKVIRPVDPVGAAKWLFAIFILSLTVALINQYIRRQQALHPGRLVLLLIGFIAVIILDVNGWISLSGGSSWFFGAVIFRPFFFLLLPALLALVYGISYRSLKWNLYPAETTRRSTQAPSATSLTLFNRLGAAGPYMELEYKLLLRNRRARATIFSAVFLAIVCMAFYFMEEMIEFKFLLVYMGLAATGMAMLSYGQFLWEGNYLDLILSRNVDLYDYYRAKYYLMIGLSIGIYLLLSPVVFLSVYFLLLNTALFLYNIGINTIVVMYLTTYSRKRLDLEESMLSPQGKGSSQYLTVLPTMILPLIVIYAPIAIVGSADLAVAAFGLLGLIGLLLHQPLLRMVVRQFKGQKFKILTAFRES